MPHPSQPPEQPSDYQPCFDPMVSRGQGGGAPLAAGAAPSSPSLDTQESSVRGDFDRFWSEKGTPAEYFADAVLDEQSHSARFRHASWASIRHRVWDSLTRTAQSNSRRVAFGSCGSYSWIEQSDDNTQRFRIRHNHCHDRLCTPCANARAAQLQAALFAQLGNGQFSFITLTLCGKAEPLAGLVDRLYKHFRALRAHPLWADNVEGGAAFLEIKWSDKAQRWHPHLHIICQARFIDQGALSNVWRTITKDSFIVDIRRVHQKAESARYVTKYASKPLNTSFSNTPALLDEALRALKGRRLCLCFGSWYGTPLSTIEDETLDFADEEHWHHFTDMESLLTKAASGDRDSIHIIQSAGIETMWRSMLLAQPPPVQ